MVWRQLSRYVEALEESNEMLRIVDPVDVELEAGCFADRLVKKGHYPHLLVMTATSSPG